MKMLGIALAACGAGVILSGSLSTAASAQQGADRATGEALFKQRCASCHTIGGKGGKIGPDLSGVAGRKAGSTAYNYSPALKGARMVWSAKALDAYLAAPAKAIPGTKMVAAVTDPTERAALVRYLVSAK